MPKMKNHKATAKRFKVKKAKTLENGTKVARIEKRTNGQGHFNARETGNTKRNKRSDKVMSASMNQTILRSIAA